MHNGFASFYRGKKVLVTGHTGFKGGWLASWLKLLGAEVTGFARPPATEPNLFTAASVDIGMQSVIGEIQDLTQVRDLFNRVQPEIVIHNAAQAIVRRSYRDPVETYATNVMGTVHILAATQQTLSVRAVVIVTSDKCYENRERVDGYREEDPMGGHDPYSSSKGAAELITAGLPSVILQRTRQRGNRLRPGRQCHRRGRLVRRPSDPRHRPRYQFRHSNHNSKS